MPVLGLVKASKSSEIVKLGKKLTCCKLSLFKSMEFSKRLIPEVRCLECPVHQSLEGIPGAETAGCDIFICAGISPLLSETAIHSHECTLDFVCWSVISVFLYQKEELQLVEEGTVLGLIPIKGIDHNSGPQCLCRVHLYFQMMVCQRACWGGRRWQLWERGGRLS